MFSKLSVVVASVLITLAAAIPNGTPLPPVTPPDTLMCCTSVVSSTSNTFSAIATILDFDLTGFPDVPIGLDCSPTAIGICGVFVICDAPEAEWGGLFAIDCIPVTL